MSDADCVHADEGGAWVLGALSPAEAARYGAHLETCPACQDEVAAMQRAADAMVEVQTPASLPAGLEARVMEHVRSEAQLLRAASAPPPPQVQVQRRIAPLAVAATVAVALLLAAGAFTTGRFTADAPGRPAVGTEALVVRETEARASLRTSESGPILTFDELGPPPRGRVYQIWLRRPGRKLASTNRLFSVSDGGQAILTLPRLDGVEEIVVTAERPTGSDSPTLPPVLIATPPGRARFRS